MLPNPAEQHARGRTLERVIASSAERLHAVS